MCDSVCDEMDALNDQHVYVKFCSNLRRKLRMLQKVLSDDAKGPVSFFSGFHGPQMDKFQLMKNGATCVYNKCIHFTYNTDSHMVNDRSCTYNVNTNKTTETTHTFLRLIQKKPSST